MVLRETRRVHRGTHGKATHEEATVRQTERRQEDIVRIHRDTQRSYGKSCTVNREIERVDRGTSRVHGDVRRVQRDI